VLLSVDLIIAFHPSGGKREQPGTLCGKTPDLYMRLNMGHAASTFPGVFKTRD
jgi:hypothetical protein